MHMPMTVAEVVIYTDGACSGNPGPGGWGSVILLIPKNFVQELGGRNPSTTNNRMEMTAAIESLNSLKNLLSTDSWNEIKIVLLTDSSYLINGIQKWVHGWRRNNWRTSEGQEVLNKDLWQIFYELAYGIFRGQIEYRYVRGHQGIPGNERCDEIGVRFSKGESPTLFRGPLNKYPVILLPLPAFQPIPEPKKIGDKKATAFSYISLVDGQVCRHNNWASCERRVKGRSGARFKKAMSASEEEKILQDWGLVGAIIKDME